MDRRWGLANGGGRERGALRDPPFLSTSHFRFTQLFELKSFAARYPAEPIPRTRCPLYVVLVFFLVLMAITVQAADKESMLAKAGADLRFLFDRKGVDEDFAVKLYSIGITSVELFAVFAKDQADLEAILKTHFEVDTNDITARVVASKIVVTWLAAKTRAQKQSDQDGDCEVRRVPKDIPVTAVNATNDAFEKKYWVLEETQMPARSYLERKLDEIEKDDLRAESLEEVVSMAEMR